MRWQHVALAQLRLLVILLPGLQQDASKPLDLHAILFNIVCVYPKYNPSPMVAFPFASSSIR